ncbi:MAG: biotin--[acetyl-CoA-carboxylase] ligase [Calditrichaeota bacterium]|nr:biotin--[acetyl-CoA-carboxylase] ligase [Calditrichota bacterium]
MLNCDKVRGSLNTSIFGRSLYCFQVIDSTNSYLLTLAREGAPEGTVVQAEYQTSGRGRKERKWHAAPCKNLLFSILVRPEIEIDFSQKITLATAIVLAETIDRYLKDSGVAPVDITFKWPNDLLVGGLKLSGILAESILREKKILALVLGVGINLNETKDQFDPALKNQATSLIQLTGQTINREKFLCMFLEQFEKDYERFERNLYREVVHEWKQRFTQIGKKVLVSTPFGDEEGIIRDVDESGYLVYEDKVGRLRSLVTGEIKKGENVTGV